MARAFVFPGQGSQKVGMGQDLAAAFAAAREVFEEVDEALKQPLTRLMFEGPAEQLILTENAQPAIMACSMAVVRVLEREGGVDLAQKAAFVAGIRWASIRRFALPERWTSVTRRGCSRSAARPCRWLYRSGRARCWH